MIFEAELSDVHLLLSQIVVNFTRYFLQSTIATVLFTLPVLLVLLTLPLLPVVLTLPVLPVTGATHTASATWCDIHTLMLWCEVHTNFGVSVHSEVNEVHT